MAIFSSLVAGFVLGQAVDSPRDIKLPIMPIWQFADWAGKETGRKVIVVPSVQDRLIYVNVKKRTLSELFGFVKRAIGVGVLDKNGVLTFTDERKAKLGGMFTREMIEKSLAELKSDVVTKADLESAIRDYERLNKKFQSELNIGVGDWEKMQELNRFDPLARGLSQALKGLSADYLLQLPDHERVVLSTSPTKLQRGWVGDSRSLMTSMTKAMQLRKEVVSAVKGKTEDESEIFYAEGRKLLSTEGGFDRPVAAMLLVLKKEPYGLVTELEVFDAKGEFLGSANEMVGVDRDSQAAFQKKFEEAYGKMTQEFALNEADQREIALNQMTLPSGSQLKPSREDLEFLSKSDVIEPYGGVISRLHDFAVGLVDCEAVIEVVYPFALMQPGKKSVTAQDAMMGLLWVHFWSGKGELPEPGGLILGDQLPDYAYQFVLPRRSTAAIARHLLQKGKFTFDEFAEQVARVSVREQIGVFASQALTLSGQNTNGSWFEPRGWNEFLVILYGSLTPQQRRMVFTPDGLTLPLSQLGGLQATFWETTRSVDLNLGDGYQGYPPEHRPDLAEQGVIPKGYPSTPWAMEQTCFLASSLSAPVSVTLQGSSLEGLYTEQVYSDGTNESRFTQFMSIDDYASQLVWRELAQQQGQGDGRSRIAGAAWAKQNAIKMVVKFGGFRAPENEVQMLNDPVEKFGEIKDLPKAVQDKVDAAIKKKREEYKDVTFGGRRSAPPPPPVH
jgi:hypothetical protein